MKRNTLMVIIVLALSVFACAFGTTSYAFTSLGPVSPSSKTVKVFTVAQGETGAQVQADLQKQGLISNSLAFKVLLKVRYKDAGFQAGVYHLSPGMSMDEIIHLLINGEPLQQVLITIGPGLRIEQYPALFQKTLPLFDSKEFLQIATTGKYADGTTVNSKYWYVLPKQKNTVNALEGYLIPDSYNFTTRDTADVVINRLLNVVGEKLCPGPDAAHIDAYILDKTQCKAHAAKVGGTSLFALLEKNYFTTNDAQALYDALTIASITQREISKTATAAQSVATIYYNRWLTSLQKLAFPYDPGASDSNYQDVVDCLGSEPTAIYAYDTDHPPSGGAYWKSPANFDPTHDEASNPYNTDACVNKGLTPGPISAPNWQWMEYAIAPKTYTSVNADSSKFFFFTHCGSYYPYHTYTQFWDAWISFGQSTNC